MSRSLFFSRDPTQFNFDEMATPASDLAAAAPGRAVASFAVKSGLAQMLKGGVIMGALTARGRGSRAYSTSMFGPAPRKILCADVTNVEEAVIAQECGAVAVMALERVPVRSHS